MTLNAGRFAIRTPQGICDTIMSRLDGGISIERGWIDVKDIDRLGG